MPREAITLLVVDADGKAAPRLSHRAGVPVNPASVTKLVTTFAALDLLGPAFTWATPVYVDGSVRDGTLHGNLYIQGQGDPKLVVERLWLLLRRVQGLGIRVDRRRHRARPQRLRDGARRTPARSTASRCGPTTPRPMRCCSTSSRCVMTFTPAGRRRRRCTSSRRWRACSGRPTCRLAAGECGDWRGGLKADFSDPARIALCRRLPGGLRRTGLAAGLRRPAQLCGARGRRPVAADGRQPRPGRCAKAGCRRAWRPRSNCARRRWPRSFATSTSSATT